MSILPCVSESRRVRDHIVGVNTDVDSSFCREQCFICFRLNRGIDIALWIEAQRRSDVHSIRRENLNGKTERRWRSLYRPPSATGCGPHTALCRSAITSGERVTCSYHFLSCQLNTVLFYTLSRKKSVCLCWVV